MKAMDCQMNTHKSIGGLSPKTIPTNQEAKSVGVIKAELLLQEKPQPITKASFPHEPQGFMKILPSTLENVEHLIRHYGVIVRYDCIKKKLRITIPGHTGTTDNADNTAITIIISLVTLNGMATGQVPAIVEAIADRHLYNPVAEWIFSKPWDGIDRLPELFDTLQVREDFSPQLKRILIYKWLLSAVAAAILPNGFKARGVLTLQGPQGIGKTSWVMALVNDPLLREMVIKVDHLLDPHNKDSILGAITHWIVEIGELDSSFKKDVARLKGVLTSNSDKVRRPYAKTESEYQRRTIFCATVNEENFLVDSTGNTRWWTLPLVSINYAHDINMQQVFAQLALDIQNGAQWWLTNDEEKLLEHHNSQHRSISLVRERLMEILDLGRVGEPGLPAMGTVETFAKMGVPYPSNGDTKELTAILRELLGASKKHGGTLKWRIPLREQIDVVKVEIPKAGFSLSQ
jgi:putative DNA primase/helicase